jgi:hypothetical protein
MALKGTGWTPFAFAVSLSVICLIAYLFGIRPSHGGASEVWIIPFLTFLPLSFHAACLDHRQTRDHIKELEARIQRLEAAAS